MRKKFALSLIAILGLLTGPLALPASVGLLGEPPQSSGPLNLPALTAAQGESMFTYLGSFAVDNSSPNGAPYASGSLYVDDSTTPHTLYFMGQICDPYGPFCSYYGWGIATLALPSTLSPGYTGGAEVPLLTPPQAPGATAEAPYTLTSSISAGAVSATFNSLPAGISANAGWHVMLGGGGGADDELITGVSGNTVSWATGTTGGYTGGTAFEIYQKTANGANNSPWTSGCVTGTTLLTGTMIIGNTLYETGGNSYDNVGCSLGWIAESTLPLSGTSWGAINLPNQPPGQDVYQKYSRTLAGVIIQTPPIWRPFFGPAYDASSHGLGINSVGPIPMGPSFQEFNPAEVTFSAGTTTKITPALLYPVSSPLSGRSYSTSQGIAVFPLNTTTGYYPATLSSTPAVNDTSETINIPSASITITADVSNTNKTITIDNLNGNTIPNSIVTYNATDTAGALSASTQFRPAQSNPPGTTIGVGTVLWPAPDPTASATSDSITLSSPFYDSTWYEMFFSDGETRIGTISGSVFTFASGQAPLSCTSGAPPCPTQSITLAPVGDGWFTDYDPYFGTGFFVPNTSTWMAITYHQYGPHSTRQYRACNGEASSNAYNAPFSPDTLNYEEAFVYLYHASDLLAGANGAQPGSLSVANPYATFKFPDSANVIDAVGCAEATNNGWAYFDPSDDILYIMKNIKGSSQSVVLEYQVTPPTG